MNLRVQIPSDLKCLCNEMVNVTVLYTVSLISSMHLRMLIKLWVQIPSKDPYGVVAKWSNAADCKSVPFGFSSSNLLHATICFGNSAVESLVSVEAGIRHLL